MHLRTSQAPSTEPADAPAVDHAGGVARLMGDTSLFARVLERFCKEYRQAAGRIRAALDAGDLETAIRLAHTLKGAASMIEAVPLRREAQRLEHLLRHGDQDPDAVLARLRAELERVLGELDTLLDVSPEQPARASEDAVAPTVRDDRDDGDDAPHRLATLLDAGNGDAVDVVRDDATALTARLGPELYVQVARAIESFDFDGALEMMQQYRPRTAQAPVD